MSGGRQIGDATSAGELTVVAFRSDPKGREEGAQKSDATSRRRAEHDQVGSSSPDQRPVQLRPRSGPRGVRRLRKEMALYRAGPAVDCCNLLLAGGAPSRSHESLGVLRSAAASPL